MAPPVAGPTLKPLSVLEEELEELEDSVNTVTIHGHHFHIYTKTLYMDRNIYLRAKKDTFIFLKGIVAVNELNMKAYSIFVFGQPQATKCTIRCKERNSVLLIDKRVQDLFLTALDEEDREKRTQKTTDAIIELCDIPGMTNIEKLCYLTNQPLNPGAAKPSTEKKEEKKQEQRSCVIL